MARRVRYEMWDENGGFVTRVEPTGVRILGWRDDHGRWRPSPPHAANGCTWADRFQAHVVASVDRTSSPSLEVRELAAEVASLQRSLKSAARIIRGHCARLAELQGPGAMETFARLSAERIILRGTLRRAGTGRATPTTRPAGRPGLASQGPVRK